MRGEKRSSCARPFGVAQDKLAKGGCPQTNIFGNLRHCSAFHRFDFSFFASLLLAA